MMFLSLKYFTVLFLIELLTGYLEAYPLEIERVCQMDKIRYAMLVAAGVHVLTMGGCVK